jgi:terminase large subunit-like protein
MSNAAPANYYRQSAVMAAKVTRKPVTLHLPPAHPRQFEFINAFNKYPDLRFIIAACGTKFGKAESIEQDIPTTSGWKKMKDLVEGDYVFDENGAPTRVEFVTDIMYGHKCYDVVFSDQSRVTVDAGHLWKTETHLARKNQARVLSPNDRCKSTSYKPEVIDTQTIKDTLLCDDERQRPNHSVDLCGPAQFDTQDLALDPYVLGVWLGNGTACCGDIASDEDDAAHLREQFSKAGFEVVDRKNPQIFGIPKLIASLRALHVLSNKHIPQQYLVGSVEQRLSLLQGLMDTDGTIGKPGHCCFDNTNKDLADGAEALAVSLGIKVLRDQRFGKIDGVAKKLCYRVRFTTDVPVFRMKRKLDRMRKISLKSKRRYIVDVVEVPSVPVRCIRVAAASHMYLTGKSFIPTHNTYGSAIALTQYAWTHKNTLSWWVAPTFAQSKVAYNLVKRMLPKDTFEEYKAEMRLVILQPDGSELSSIEFKSGQDPDGLRGFGVNFFVLDEAARVDYESWVSLLTTITQTEGKGYIISTPHARNWFYDIYKRGEKTDERDGSDLYGPGNPDPYPEWYSMKMPTWTNPHVSLRAIELLRSTLPADSFTQEVGAQFLADSAGVFRGVSHCIKGEFSHPMPGGSYVMGVDLARLKDFTVLTVMDRLSRHVVYWERFNQVEWEVQYARILEVGRRYKAVACIDSTGIGDVVVSAIRNGGLRVQEFKISSNTLKRQLVERLSLSIQNQRISFPHLPILKKELESYEFDVSSNGLVRYSAPAGQHDDCVISLALANFVADADRWVYRYSNQRGI